MHISIPCNTTFDTIELDFQAGYGLAEDGVGGGSWVSQQRAGHQTP
jgi:hypothetical protein